MSKLAERVVKRYAKKKVPPEFLEQQKKMKEKAKGNSDKDEKKGGDSKGKGKIPPQFLSKQKSKKTAAEEPNIAVRRKAYNIARSIARRQFLDENQPLEKAAKAYFNALDKTRSEDERYELANELITQIEDAIESAELEIKVLADAKGLITDAAGDHNALAYYE